MDAFQEEFLARARARQHELTGLRDEAQETLTSDDFADAERELLRNLDEVHGAITRALRGQLASLASRPVTRFTLYRLDVLAGTWVRTFTTRDTATAVRQLIDLQSSGEIAHMVPWMTLGDRAERERDASKFRPQLAVVDARDHVISM